jgi:hypothetical protein
MNNVDHYRILKTKFISTEGRVRLNRNALTHQAHTHFMQYEIQNHDAQEQEHHLETVRFLTPHAIPRNPRPGALLRPHAPHDVLIMGVQ